MTTTTLQATKSATTEAKPDSVSSVVLESVRFGWAGGDKPDLVMGELRIAAGERLFIEGPSGSGKSTLLSLLAGERSSRLGAGLLEAKPTPGQFNALAATAWHRCSQGSRVPLKKRRNFCTKVR